MACTGDCSSRCMDSSYCGSNCSSSCHGYCGNGSGTNSASTDCAADCTMYCAVACYQGCDGGCSGCSGGCQDNCATGCSGTCTGGCTNSCKGTCNAGCENSARYSDLVLNKKIYMNDIKNINDAITFEVVNRRDKTLKHTISFNQKEHIDDEKINKLIENLQAIDQIPAYSATIKNKAIKKLPEDLIAKIKAANAIEIKLP